MLTTTTVPSVMSQASVETVLKASPALTWKCQVRNSPSNKIHHDFSVLNSLYHRGRGCNCVYAEVVSHMIEIPLFPLISSQIYEYISFMGVSY